MTSTTQTAVTVHPFERAGLGVAPFRFMGVTKNWFSAGPDDPGKPGGSCDFCGNGIAYEFWIRDATDKRFKVGCDCVAKLARADARVKCADRVIADIQNAARKMENQRRAEREAAKRQPEYARIGAAVEAFKANRAAFEAQPHPRGFKSYETGRPLTLADSIEWMMANAGHAGRLATAKEIEAVIALSAR